MTPNGRILIVEDDVAVREMLAEYLRTHGYEVVEVDRGVAMRGAVESALPDVVLLDVNLPGEDGFTLARFLRERCVGMSVSATTGSRTASPALEIGADDHVGKPFDPAARATGVARIRRRGPPGACARPQTRRQLPFRVRVGVCSFDLASRSVRRRRRRVSLTNGRVRPAQGVHRASQPASQPGPAAHAYPQPRVGTLRPIHRHSHRAIAAQDRARPGAPGNHSHGARRRLHIRAAVVTFGARLRHPRRRSRVTGSFPL